MLHPPRPFGRSVNPFVLFAALFAATCGSRPHDPADDLPVVASGDVTAAGTVDAHGGVLKLASGAELVIGAGALASPTEVSISAVASIPPGVPAPPDGLTLVAEVITTLPHGQTFELPVEIRIPTPPNIPGGAVSLFTQAGDDSEWVEHTNVTIADGVAAARTTHFSHWAWLRKPSIGGAGSKRSVEHVQWTNQFGFDSADEVTALAVAPDGSVVAAGVTWGAFSGFQQGGNGDAFVRKYDENGAVLWTRQFGFGSYEHAKAITTDASGTIYVAGEALHLLAEETDPARIGGAFVRTYGAHGDLEGSFQLKKIGDSSEIMAIAVQGSELVIAGSQGSPPTAPAYTVRDLFVRRIDVTGNAVWGDVLDGKQGPNDNSSDSACGVAADGEGNTVLLGQLNGPLEGVSSRWGVVVRKYGPTGAPLWTKVFENARCAVNGGALRVAANGHIYVVASSEIRKLAPNGDVLWTKDVFPLGASCVALAPSALIVAGFTRDVPVAEGEHEDIFVRKYDLDGNELWTRQVGSPQADAPYALDVDSAGRIYIGGQSMSYGSLPHLLAPAAVGAFLMQMKP